MSTNDTPEQSDGALLLPDMLDLRAAVPLSAEFAARRGRTVAVDASRVRRLGGLCLQVLQSASACWMAEGIGFRVVAPSADFMDGLALMGAASLLPNHET